MKIKTSELEGAALDWAVSYATNGSKAFFDAFGARMLGRSIAKSVSNGDIRPSTDWSQGGPILESRMIEAYSNCEHEVFVANEQTMTYSLGEGDTLLIAAMRAIVASEIGDEVDVPEELL